MRIPEHIKQESALIYLLCLGILGGLGIIFGPARPGTVEVLLPAWLVLLWGIQLTIGCTVAVLGVVLRKLYWEKRGLILLIPITLVYAMCVAFVLKSKSFLVVVPYLGFAQVCYWRIRYVNRVIARAEEMRSDQ